MIALQKGGNALVTTREPTVVMRTERGAVLGDFDFSAFLLSDGKVLGDAGMVFYGQRTSDGVSLVTEHNASETRFQVSLAALPPTIQRVAFTATIDGRSAFGQAKLVTIEVRGGEPISFDVPLAGATEAALILGELYLRNGDWKFRAIGQGFVGGLQPLAESFGVVIAAAVPPAAPVKPPAPPISLSKITLSKARPSINLAKKANGFGEIKVNLNWSRKTGLFRRETDLDLGCLYELRNGDMGAVQALGTSFGAYEQAPFVELAGDDRTGANRDGEWLRINGVHWSDIRRLLIYAFIYEGVANWTETDGVVTLYAPDAAPVEVRLNEGSAGKSMCAVALIENIGDEARLSRQVQYFGGHRVMDDAYGWGLKWSAGSKN